MPKKAYTEEQKQNAIARASEIGVRKTADEFTIPWQTVASWVRATKPKSDVKTKKGTKKQDESVKAPKTDEKAVKNEKKLSVSTSVEKLIAENATLKAEKAELLDKIKRLKKAIQTLS